MNNMKILSVFMEPLLVEALTNQEQYFKLLEILSEDNIVEFKYLNNEQKEYFEKNNIYFNNKMNNIYFDVLFVFGGRMKSITDIENDIDNKEGIYYDLYNLIKDRNNFIIANYLYDPKISKLSDLKQLKTKDIKYIYFNAYNYLEQKSINLFEYFCFKDIDKKEKDIDFCFGYTASPITERKYLSDFVNNYIEENDKILIFCKDRFTGRNNLINQKEYFEKIKRSKYSLVAPSNDKTAFSFSRLLECISNNCIPFILNDCNLEILKENYIELYDYFISNNLIIDYNKNINEIIKNFDYNDLIQKINKLKCIKDFSNENKMKQKIKENFIGGIKSV